MVKAQKELPDLNLQDVLLEVQEEETELDKIFKIVLSPDYIRHNTELTSNEITAFSVLGSIVNQRPELVALRDFITENLTLRVSRKRQGKKELVKMAQRALNQEDSEFSHGGNGTWGRYFRRRGGR